MTLKQAYNRGYRMVRLAHWAMGQHCQLQPDGDSFLLGVETEMMYLHDEAQRHFHSKHWLPVLGSFAMFREDAGAIKHRMGEG